MILPVSRPVFVFLKMIGCPVVWEVSVGAVVFRMEDKRRLYLLLRYPSGHFDFVKGHMEEGETEEITLRRETMEETGIEDLIIYKKRTSIRYFYRAKGTEREKRLRQGRGTWIFKQVHFYPAETKVENVRISEEHTGALWLPYEEALAQVTFENARRVLSETENHLVKK